jgi:hypothetical protein
MSVHDGHHGSSLIASVIGGATAVFVPADGPWGRFLVGLATTVAGWIVTRLITWAERKWKERTK